MSDNPLHCQCPGCQEFRLKGGKVPAPDRPPEGWPQEVKQLLEDLNKVANVYPGTNAWSKDVCQRAFSMIRKLTASPAAPASGAEWQRPILLALGYFKSIAYEAGRWGKPAQARYDAALAALSAAPSPPGWEEAREAVFGNDPEMPEAIQPIGWLHTMVEFCRDLSEQQLSELGQDDPDAFSTMVFEVSRLHEKLRSLTASSPSSATERYLKHCEACGTLTDTNSCDCTRDGKPPHFVPWLLADLEAAEQARASGGTEQTTKVPKWEMNAMDQYTREAEAERAEHEAGASSATDAAQREALSECCSALVRARRQIEANAVMPVNTDWISPIISKARDALRDEPSGKEKP